MHIWDKTVNLTICLILFLAAAPGAQTGYRPADEFGEFRFGIAAADFRADEKDTNRLEIYYKIFYDGLSYAKIGDGYEARYTVSAVIENNNGIQLEGLSRDGFIKVKTYAETRRSTDFVINMFDIKVPNGEDLTIRAELDDKLSQTSYQMEKNLDDRDYWGKYPSLSRIQFAREITPAEQESKFNKDSLRVIPSVSKVFGGAGDSVLAFYHEVYPGRYKDKYSKIVSKIYHRAKGFVITDTLILGKIDTTRKRACRLDISELMPGYYELELRLEGRRGKVYNKLIEEFELELTAESVFRTDYETAVEMVKYLATRSEFKMLKEAESPERRRAAWDEFWRLRDEDPHTLENPTKREYFRRIRHANRYFSIMKREGWRTNRGVIYITYGEPDEVEDYPFELSTKPYQVWLYYKSNPPRRFLFVDEWGNGDYELKPPYNGIGF